jgi:DNA ligase-1
MSDILDVLNSFVIEANQTNSINEKKEVISRYPELKRIWEYIYSDFIQFGVTSKVLSKQVSEKGNKYSDIYSLLDALRNRDITGHKAISSVQYFIFEHEKHAELIMNIIDKNIKTRTDDKLINKVFPGTIPVFDVALANSYKDQENKVNFEKDVWFASRKIDGVRCIAMFDNNGDIKFFSRQGKEFLTLGKLKEDLKSLNYKNIVLDGEVCLVDKNGDENFAGIMKVIKKKDYTIDNPKYLIFDKIKLEDFLSGTSTEVYSARISNLSVDMIKHKDRCFEMLKQIPVENKEQFEKLREEARTKNWEGLILRKSTAYEGKRSNNLLKVKDFIDAEYKVVGTENGPVRFTGENGLEQEEIMLSSVFIEHKGNKVNVGSGFVLDERKLYFKDPNLIVGETITVSYFEESVDEKTGKPSLRFPVFKGIRNYE